MDVHSAYGDCCYVGLRHSFCHGWASVPTAWLSQYVLGVEVIESGCIVVKIRPHWGELKGVEGTYPTPSVMITKKLYTVLCHCEERSDAAISMYFIVV